MLEVAEALQTHPLPRPPKAPMRRPTVILSTGLARQLPLSPISVRKTRRLGAYLLRFHLQARQHMPPSRLRMQRQRLQQALPARPPQFQRRLALESEPLSLRCRFNLLHTILWPMAIWNKGGSVVLEKVS